MNERPLQNAPENVTMPLHEACRQASYGKVEGIAIDLVKSISTIHKYGEDPEYSGSPIPGNLIVPFCKSAGDYRPIECLANQLGLVVFKIPEATDDHNFERLASLTKEFSDGLQAAGEALRDGKITVAEFKRIEKEFLEFITEAKSTMEAFRSQVQDE